MKRFKRKRFRAGLVILVFLLLSSLLFWGDAVHRSQKTSDFTLHFGGYDWQVSDTDELVEPGPNFFSKQNASVDSNGLYLKITYSQDHWYCASVELHHSVGKGKYIFQVNGDFTQLDRNVVVGLFLYQSDSQEYDIEFSRWGDPAVQPLQYSVQPKFTRAYPTEPASETTHIIDWDGNKVRFSSYYGTYENRGEMIASWEKTVPPKDQIQHGKLDMNIWLFQGRPDTDSDTNKEIVISKFMYLPA